ncbi:hypothetical protein SORBI_3008G045600 [Sorghum bicolor]|uniref:Uncharacterized protein n=1 Tax=Sorghum bicolor TaxID=4558 RepID=C5YS83_SORBI|nr:hypothetical protein SORBI_3008G045600 [Sorghum bicolor]
MLPEDEYKTAFKTHHGHYQFKVPPPFPISVCPLDLLTSTATSPAAKGRDNDARHQAVLIIAGYNDNAGRDVLVDIMDLSGQIIKKVHGMEGDRAASVSLDCIFVRKIDDSCSSYRLFNPVREELFYLPDKLLDPATGAVYRIPDNFAEEHVELSSNLIEPKYLFGQVACTGEYKIFRMLFHFSIGIGRRQMFEVCTLNSSSCAGWRAAPLEEAIQMGRFTSVVINGVVYCLCFHAHHSIAFDKQVSEKDLIFTFDLETEAWGPSIRGPPITFPDDANLMFNELVESKHFSAVARYTGNLLSLKC